MDHIKPCEQNWAWSILLSVNLDLTVAGMLNYRQHRLQSPGDRSMWEQMGTVGAGLERKCECSVVP